MKKAGYFNTSNWHTIDYTNDVEITDLETRDYNSDTNVNSLYEDIKIPPTATWTDLKKTSKTQEAAKKLLKNTRKLVNLN